MDAISYLVSRKEFSPRKASLILLFISAFSTFNIYALGWVEKNFAHATNVGFGSFLFGTAAFVAACGLFFSILATTVLLPVTVTSRICGTLRSWSENRILEELTSTGLTYKELLNQLVKHYLKCWVIIALPSTLFFLAMGAYVDSLDDFFQAWVNVQLSLIAVGAISICFTCWRISTGVRGFLFMLIPGVLLFGAPLATLEIVSYARCCGDVYTYNTFLLSIVYLIVASRYLGLRALHNQNRARSISFKLFRSTAARSTQLKKGQLSENPIVCRQEMLGHSFANILTTVSMVSAVVLSGIYSIDEGSPWLLYFILLFLGVVQAGRAATRLSQSLTKELEGSTLELLRSTPMGSERFLKGWLAIASRPLALEMAAMVILAAPFFLASTSEEKWLNGHFVFAALFAVICPFLGGLFGASIAGQCKPRHEIQSQISGTITAVGLFSIPQMLVLMADYEQGWTNIVGIALLFWITSFLLKAGAEKSLNRVFLPQK